MKINEMIREIRNRGISIWCENGKIHYIKKNGKLDEDIKEILIENKMEIISHLEEDRERFKNFPLTDIQMAYLLGRRGSFEYGDVASHLYLELDYPLLDSTRVEKIWNQLITEHDMLRAIVLQDGSQKVLEGVNDYQIYVSSDNTEENTIRHKWSDKFYNTEEWPLFDIGITKNAEKDILHLSFDFLIADWTSIWTLLREFEARYYEKEYNIAKSPISFRNYVLNERGMKNCPKYHEDKNYWEKRLDTIPGAPVLPLKSDSKQVNTFKRLSGKIEKNRWGKIKEYTMKYGITPTSAVLSIFAMCIERWSENKRFALNLTTLTRNNKYPNIYNVIGDFTSVTVLEIDLTEEMIFNEFAKKVNRQLFEDLDHNSYTGVEVIRDLRKARKDSSLFYPIIFTSSIGLVELDGMVGKINGNGISQTPQAFLDCQVMDSETGLFINWDVREGIFEEDVIQDIFSVFVKSLKSLSDSSENWSQRINISLPESQMIIRERINDTFKAIEPDTLQNLFLKSALKMPQNIAVIDNEGEHTYSELLYTANGIAEELQKIGCKRGDYVGIKLDKGFFQIAGVLGSLLIGAAFVPIDNEQPEIRAEKIMDTAQIVCLIGDDDIPRRYKEKYECLEVTHVQMKKSYDGSVLDNISDVAYVIFTSGSTGTPKGVIIEQQAVVNTIKDMNDRLEVNAEDSVLALSQLHFDLSIYDIFGMLAAGGKIILPYKDRYKDPSYWLMLTEKYKITLWNSVPAFMDIFVDYLERFYESNELPINKILLSGDWIKKNLPRKIRNFAGSAAIYSLGGATEASIWSIIHECRPGEHYTKSIPYGYPLANQGFKILDIKRRECPDMVQGELYITGKGVAKGYLGDVEKTQNSFLISNNERMYKTGDFGRYMKNGEIEFLGRKDSQIKILGHRIEIGEIENALMDCNIAKSCCVVTVDLHSESKIVALIVSKDGSHKDEEEILQKLKCYLPYYMIPFAIEYVEHIPYTNNGKVDRKTVQKIFMGRINEKEQRKTWEMNDLLEKKIYNILTKTLKIDELYPDDNLFEKGADSLIMAQIAGNIKESMEQKVFTFDEILRQILNNPTGKALVEFIRGTHNLSTYEKKNTESIRLLDKNPHNTLYVFFHAALGTTNCYRFIEQEMDNINQYDLLFINVDNVEKYCSVNTDDLVDKLTDIYTEQIASLKYKHVNLVGYCLGGILALNVAVKLLEAGIEIDNLFVLDSYPVSGKIEDDFIDEIIFLPNYQITLSEVIKGVDDLELIELIEKQRVCNNGNIPKNTLRDIMEYNKSLKGYNGILSFSKKTTEERFTEYTKTIEKKFQLEINSGLLKDAFEIYQHSFRGANVGLPFYGGDICYLSATEDQKYLFVDKEKNLEKWNGICLGDFEVVAIPGNHVTCILDKQNALEVTHILIEKGNE